MWAPSENKEDLVIWFDMRTASEMTMIRSGIGSQQSALAWLTNNKFTLASAQFECFKQGQMHDVIKLLESSSLNMKNIMLKHLKKIHFWIKVGTQNS